MNTNENVENVMKYLQVENWYIVEEMAFDELIIPGYDSDHYIFLGRTWNYIFEWYSLGQS